MTRRCAARLTLTSLALAASVALPLTAMAQSGPKHRLHTVEQGDSCWSIAQRYLGRGARYTAIHKLNDLGPMPHLLKPGQIIKLPLAAEAPDAKIDWLQRDVKARAPLRPDWRDARKNMGLWRLYRVATGKASAAGIVFEDHSRLRMRQRALLVIYGRSTTATRVRTRVKTQVVVEAGVVRGGLARLDHAAALSIKTPSGEVKLRSRSSQIEVDEKRSAIISVYDGKADVSAQGKTVSVPQDFGTFVKRGARPAKPRPLPPPPRWADPGDTLVVVAPGAEGSFEARWSPEKRAKRYRVELARDAAFRFPIVDAVVGAGIRRFRAERLKPATYFARIASIDAVRLEGRPTRVRRVQVSAVRTSRRLQLLPDGGYEAVGLLRLEIPRAGRADALVSVDGSAFAPTRVVRLSRPGRHTLRIRRGAGGGVSTLAVTLLKVRATLELPAGLQAPGATVKALLHVRDERGRPAVLPGIALATDPGGELKLTPRGAGDYQAELHVPTDAPRITVAARWAAGELTRGSVQATVKAAPPPPVVAPPPPPPPPLAFVPLQWGRPVVGLPARPVRPTTHLGFSAALAGLHDEGPRADPLHLRLAVDGGVALLDGRLGLDLELPWFNGDLQEDRAGQSELGDLRLGARWLALRRGRFEIGPSLRVTLPTGDRLREQKVAQIEPALLAAWRPSQRVVIAGAAAVGLVTDAESLGLTTAVAVGATYRFWRGFSVGTEVDWLLRVRALGGGEDPASAVAMSGLLAWSNRTGRLALVGGAGLDRDAQDWIGTFAAGLRAELWLR